jgi:hypothetical protein
VATTVGANGETTSGTDTLNLERGAINGMSWPGRLHAATTVVPLDLAVSDPALVPLASTDGRQILFARQPYPGSLETVGLSVLDVEQRRLTATVGMSSGAGVFVRHVHVAPDRRSVFVSFMYPQEGQSQYFSFDMPLAQARAQSAEVVRYDARSLEELRRVRLPAVQSAFQPDRGFPRAWISRLLVSPIDGESFVASAAGMLLFGPSSDVPATLVAPDAEVFVPPYYMLTLDQALARGWDATTNEVHFTYEPPGFNPVLPRGPYRVSAEPAAFSVAAMTSAPDLPWSTSGNEVASDRGILFGVNSQYNSASPTLFDRSGVAQASVSNAAQRCTTALGPLVCHDSSTYVRYDNRTLQATATASMNWDLRWRASQQEFADFSVLARPSPGEIIGAAASRGRAGGVEVQVVSLRDWAVR